MRSALGSDLRDGSCGRADRARGGGAAGPGADLGDGAPGLAFRAAAEPLRYLVATLVAAEDSGGFGHEPTVSGGSDTSASPRTALTVDHCEGWLAGCGAIWSPVSLPCAFSHISTRMSYAALPISSVS